MAITKVTFDGADMAAKVAEIGTFLQTYVANYFDSISYDADNGAVCKINDAETLVIKPTGYRTITLSNGNSYTDGREMGSVPYGYATDNGVWINGYYTAVGDRSLFIAKTNAGKTAILWCYGTSTSNADRAAPRGFIPSTSQNQTYYGANYSTTFSTTISQMVASSGITVFAPIGFQNGDYCNDLFFTPFSQYRGYQGIITDGSGNNYIYDGMFALKD